MEHPAKRALNRHRIGHREHLLSFSMSSDEESASESDNSAPSYNTPVEATSLDHAFSHALESWQADTLTDHSVAPKRFLILMPAHRLRPLRPEQRCSVLFAYDYV